MMDIRMKQLQQRYTKELSEALENLEQNYNSTRHEAFEKLVWPALGLNNLMLFHQRYTKCLIPTGKKV